jgi:protein-S-isoprenylcysteine O-methyltransferase Ste14
VTMSAAVVALRILSLLAFAGPMSLLATSRHRGAGTRERRSSRERAPVAANIASIVLFLASLLLSPSTAASPTSLLPAMSGSLLSVAAAALVVRSRAELGAAWRLVADADQSTGLITAGPYGLVRHPMYLGFALLTLGQATAFGSWPALLIVLLAVLPTLAWRAHVEEKVLSDTFGERYADYRRRTRMIVPYLL